MEYSDYLETRTPTTGFAGPEIMGMSQDGAARSWTFDLMNPYRGDYAGTSAFPSSGGRFTGGAPCRGDRWRLTDTLEVGGNTYDVGTVVEAAVNGADPNDPADWNKYGTQV